MIRKVRERVSNIDQAVIGVHCHNDLGMATANTVEALLNGARQAEVAVNGVGERTGDARLEEVVNALCMPAAMCCNYPPASTRS